MNGFLLVRHQSSTHQQPNGGLSLRRVHEQILHWTVRLNAPLGAGATGKGRWSFAIMRPGGRVDLPQTQGPNVTHTTTCHLFPVLLFQSQTLQGLRMCKGRVWSHCKVMSNFKSLCWSTGNSLTSSFRDGCCGQGMVTAYLLLRSIPRVLIVDDAGGGNTRCRIVYES